MISYFTFVTNLLILLKQKKKVIVQKQKANLSHIVTTWFNGHNKTVDTVSKTNHCVQYVQMNK